MAGEQVIAGRYRIEGRLGVGVDGVVSGVVCGVDGVVGVLCVVGTVVVVVAVVEVVAGVVTAVVVVVVLVDGAGRHWVSASWLTVEAPWPRFWTSLVLVWEGRS